MVTGNCFFCLVFFLAATCITIIKNLSTECISLQDNNTESKVMLPEHVAALDKQECSYLLQTHLVSGALAFAPLEVTANTMRLQHLSVKYCGLEGCSRDVGPLSVNGLCLQLWMTQGKSITAL